MTWGEALAAAVTGLGLWLLFVGTIVAEIALCAVTIALFHSRRPLKGVAALCLLCALMVAIVAGGIHRHANRPATSAEEPAR